MAHRINLNMVENGLDFISKSLQTIERPDEDLKYSLINLHAGIQLLLKEILFQEHWSLIFQSIESADKDKLKSGDFISVNYDTLIKRLQKISGIKFDENLLDMMDWLRKERNKTEHYHFVVTADVLKSNIVKLFAYLIPFIKSEMIETELIDSDDERFSEIQEYLNEFDEYVKERLQLIQKKLKNVDVILQCPICNQETVEFTDETDAFCYFCDGNIKNFTEQYIDSFVDRYSHVMDGGEDPLLECPECDLETFLCLDGYQYVCLTCGVKPTQDNLTTCNGPRCNEKLIYRRYSDDGGYEADFCNICMDYFKHA
ncbi:hypothetical protein MJA45_03940 [Paenibacillus aurantius]|uniref:DUF4145 domain-containing protein n=1 Tax=Paenibacillus aurantius TaxID=2918900 RepID=A0AA96LIQ0_9BACL|nr:hypothetical protein [Paenibacillus aurantius]WNQ12212.1 hypothetical protein MJA45_03940 [Paenibacillus aurantius]